MTALRRSNSKIILIFLFAILIFVIFATNVFADSDATPVFTWDISATDEDSVSASLFQLSPGEYSIEIKGSGKMKNFSDLVSPPWFRYADGIVLAVIGADVENLGRFTFNNCFNLEKALIEGTALVLPADVFPIPDETVVFAHINSNVFDYLSINNPERFSPLCKFDNSVCMTCSYQCINHRGGEAGCTDGALCTICGCEYEVKKGHDLGEIVPQKPASCTDEGMKEHYICSRCGLYFDGEENLTSKDELLIPKTHKLGNLIPYSAPNCTDLGILAHRHCALCEANFDENGVELDNIYLPATDHKGGRATCISGAICDICNKPYGEIDASCHSFSLSLSYDLTAHWYECACGEVKEREKHSFISQVIKPQTIEEEGILEHSCTCGHKYRQKLPKLSNPDNILLPSDDDGKSFTWVFILIGCASVVGIGTLAVIITLKKRNK